MIVMNGALFTVLISGAFTIVGSVSAVALANFYGRKRDHEADWRKMKLEYYKEYVAAFFEATRPGSDASPRQRYEAAANNLNLVASPKVLIAHYAFQEEVSQENQNRGSLKGDSLLNSLMRAMREDCHPKPLKDPIGFTYRRLNIPTGVRKDKKLHPE